MSIDQQLNTIERNSATFTRQTTGAIVSQGSPSTESTIPQTSTQSTEQAKSSILTEEQNARRQCLETIVANFRGGKQSRVGTYSDILNELEQDPELTEEEKETAFGIISAEIGTTEARAQ